MGLHLDYIIGNLELLHFTDEDMHASLAPGQASVSGRRKGVPFFLASAGRNLRWFRDTEGNGSFSLV